MGRGQEGEEEMARREKTWQKSKKRGQVALVVWHRFESAPEGIAVSNLPNLKRLNYLKLRGVSLAAIAGFHGIKFAQNDSNADDEELMMSQLFQFFPQKWSNFSFPDSRAAPRQQALLQGASAHALQVHLDSHWGG